MVRKGKKRKRDKRDKRESKGNEILIKDTGARVVHAIALTVHTLPLLSYLPKKNNYK